MTWVPSRLNSPSSWRNTLRISPNRNLCSAGSYIYDEEELSHLQKLLTTSSGALLLIRPTCALACSVHHARIMLFSTAKVCVGRTASPNMAAVCADPLA